MNDQMNASELDNQEALVTRTLAIQLLSKIRHPSERPISQSTLWRWCELGGIPTGRLEFTFDQFGVLARIANFYRQGLKKNQIKRKLGDTNYEHSKQQNSQGFWKSSESRDNGFDVGSIFTGFSS